MSHAPAPFFSCTQGGPPWEACQRAQKLLSLGRWHELNSLGPGGPLDCSII